MNTHPLRFIRAVQALMQGYFYDELQAGNCHACAVGQIIAKANGLKLESNPFGTNMLICPKLPRWSSVFQTNSDGQTIKPQYYTGRTKFGIDATGYSWEELALVEKTFEAATSIKLDTDSYYGVHNTPEEIDADQYNGLMAVIDVLCQIEGISDPEPTKALFVKSASPVVPASV